jgi:hypothetical protein
VRRDVTLRRTELPDILAKFSDAAAHGAPAQRLSPASGAYRRLSADITSLHPHHSR